MYNTMDEIDWWIVDNLNGLMTGQVFNVKQEVDAQDEAFFMIQRRELRPDETPRRIGDEAGAGERNLYVKNNEWS